MGDWAICRLGDQEERLSSHSYGAAHARARVPQAIIRRYPGEEIGICAPRLCDGKRRTGVRGGRKGMRAAAAGMAGVLAVLAMATMVPAGRAQSKARSADMAGIEKLHEADKEATLAHDRDQLLALWTEDGVALQVGQPPMVGKTAIRAAMDENFRQYPGMKVLKYSTDIRDVQVSGDAAYEWGFFEVTGKVTAAGAASTFKARMLRVMRRQVDGSWKFARVMWMPE